jgi:hypothetical protein
MKNRKERRNMANNDDQQNTVARERLLKEAFDVILQLNDEKLKILLERMECEIGGAA